MSDRIVQKETFVGMVDRVELLTVESTESLRYSQYFVIVKNGDIVYTSNDIYGGTGVDIARNCDTALQVVRKLLTDTGFLIGEVVGA